MRRESITSEYISGFVDGEGCFSLTMRRDVRHERESKAVYYSWKALFIIVLHIDDKELLEYIQEHLHCGSVTTTKKDVRFQVSDITDLYEYIIPFFRGNPLIGKKSKDFDLWAEAVEILMKYKKKRGKVNIQKGVRGFQKTTWEEGDIVKLTDLHAKITAHKAQKKNKKWAHKNIGRSHSQEK